MPESPGYRQIKQVRLTYDHDTVVPLPKRLSVLDVIVMPDTHDKLNIPYLIYLDEGGETELKTLRLISGQAELDYRYESWRYQGTIPQKKRHHPNFATLWLITKKKEQPPPPKAPPKKVTPPNPESVKAREAAERAEREKADIEASLAGAGAEAE